MTDVEANASAREQKVERDQIERAVRAKAARRVYARLGFYWHASAFVLANLAMVAINFRYTPNTLWFVWPLGGWGAALFFHAFATFQTQGVTEQMIDAEVQRELARRRSS